MDNRTHLNHTTDELVVILAEECAEVTQAITKLLRHGGDCYNPKDPKRERNIEALHREVGDFLVTLDLLYQNGLLDEQVIRAYHDAKMARVRAGDTPLHHKPILR